VHDTFAQILEEFATRRVFARAATAWANGDWETTLRAMSDDVVRCVNVDGDLVPFAASVIGKPAMREKLILMHKLFEFGAFITEDLSVSGSHARARMRILFIHRRTGERLNTTFRMLVTVQDDLITELNEFHDASYLEAFARLVEYHSV
jgi:ketosteroid isomerase-like protein